VSLDRSLEEFCGVKTLKNLSLEDAWSRGSDRRVEAPSTGSPWNLQEEHWRLANRIFLNPPG
jgi:hypothetical protein